MSRATSPASAAPLSLPTITVALCASAKKHQQSFDTLREYAKQHNARVIAQHGSQAAMSTRTVRADPSAVLSSEEHRGARTPPGPKGRAASKSAAEDAERAAARPNQCTSRTSVANPMMRYLFRFVNLNYDSQHHCMLVSADEEVKGEVPKRLHHGEAKSKEDSDNESTLSVDTLAEAARLADEVDVVFHKVATFGSPSAIRALKRWCAQTQARRIRRRRTPLVVVDPLDKVGLLMTRSMLYKLLDNTGADGKSVALIPCTFMWDRPSAAANVRKGTADGGVTDDSLATPLGIHSFLVIEEEENHKDPRANGTAGGRWWIAKPDEGTGPAFTHHLIMWCTRDNGVGVPPAVQVALPKESNRFILQELYVYALPVIIKVYYISPHIYIKVKPTVNLLSHVWEQTNGFSLLDVPVMMDSQDKNLFSSVASVSANTSRPTLSATTSGADYGACNSDTLPPLRSADKSSPLSEGNAGSSGAPPPPTPWEAMIAPGEMWDAFLAPGTPAYTAIYKMAQDMSGYGGVGLSLYGFDIVLLPNQLGHTYHREASRGIGHTEGATVRYEPVTPTPGKLLRRNSLLSGGLTPRASAENGGGGGRSSSKKATPAAASGVGASAGGTTSAAAPQLTQANEMFNLSTGAPTSLLLDSIPVVIDVNYFPGYNGVGEADQHMLELLATKYAEQTKDGKAPSAQRSDESAGSRDKKRRCETM